VGGLQPWIKEDFEISAVIWDWERGEVGAAQRQGSESGERSAGVGLSLGRGEGGEGPQSEKLARREKATGGERGRGVWVGGRGVWGCWGLICGFGS
jgi:hypothetical protein